MAVKNNQELISVIVPVYNVQKYIRPCLNSIINQTYSNLEIILVDDGSTDKSGKICDEYALLDDRIIVIHQENAGQSAARNRALEIMKGQYVTFVDSDDVIELNYLEALYWAICKDNADVSATQFSIASSIKDNMVSDNEFRTVVCSGLEYEWTRRNIKPYCSYLKLFRRYLFDKTRYTEGVLYEDSLLFPYLISGVERVTDILNGPMYIYRHRLGSTMDNFHNNCLTADLSKVFLTVMKKLENKYGIAGVETIKIGYVMYKMAFHNILKSSKVSAGFMRYYRITLIKYGKTIASNQWTDNMQITNTMIISFISPYLAQKLCSFEPFSEDLERRYNKAIS